MDEEGFFKRYNAIAQKAMPFVIIFFLISLSFLIYQNQTTGSFIQKDISLAGGVTFTFTAQPDRAQLQSVAQDMLQSSVIVKRIGSETVVESGAQDQDLIDSFRTYLTQEYSITEQAITVQFIGETLGASFFRETLFAIMLAFIFMAIVVIIIFRKLLPALYIIFAAAAILVQTVFITNLFNITISTGGLAAFLMLLGYSVDTDIVLTTRTIKDKSESIAYRIAHSFRTGMTMSLTSLAAVSVGYIVSNSPLIKEIMLILAIGLLFDMMNTWLFNAPLIVRYEEAIENKVKSR